MNNLVWRKERQFAVRASKQVYQYYGQQQSMQRRHMQLHHAVKVTASTVLQNYARRKSVNASCGLRSCCLQLNSGL